MIYSVLSAIVLITSVYLGKIFRAFFLHQSIGVSLAFPKLLHILTASTGPKCDLLTVLPFIISLYIVIIFILHTRATLALWQIASGRFSEKHTKKIYRRSEMKTAKQKNSSKHHFWNQLDLRSDSLRPWRSVTILFGRAMYTWFFTKRWTYLNEDFPWLILWVILVVPCWYTVWLASGVIGSHIKAFSTTRNHISTSDAALYVLQDSTLKVQVY